MSELPFPDGTFDLVTAVETHYSWPDLAKDMREILRVVKPGGVLIIIAESYKSSKHDFAHQLPMKLLRAAHLSIEEHRQLLAAAGLQGLDVRDGPEAACPRLTPERRSGTLSPLSP